MKDIYKKILISFSALLIVLSFSFSNVSAFGETTVSAVKSEWLIDYIRQYVPEVLSPVDNYWYIVWKEYDGTIVVEFSPKRYLTDYTGTGTSIYTDYYINYDVSMPGLENYVVGSVQDSNFVPGWDRIIHIEMNDTNITHSIESFSIPTDLKQSNGYGNRFIYTNMDISGGPSNDNLYPWSALTSSNYLPSKALEDNIYQFIMSNSSSFPTDFRYVLSEMISPTESLIIDKNKQLYHLYVLPATSTHKLYYQTEKDEYALMFNLNHVFGSNDANGIIKSYLIESNSPGIYSFTEFVGSTHTYNRSLYFSKPLYPAVRYYPYDENRIYGFGGRIGLESFKGSASLLIATNLTLEGGIYNGYTKKLSDLEWMIENSGNRPLLPPITSDPDDPTYPSGPNNPGDGGGGGDWTDGTIIPGFGDRPLITKVQSKIPCYTEIMTSWDNLLNTSGVDYIYSYTLFNETYELNVSSLLNSFSSVSILVKNVLRFALWFTFLKGLLRRLSKFLSDQGTEGV